MLSRPASRLAALAGLLLLALAAPAAAQCWSGGETGKGVPRESLLIANQTSFPVNVLAGQVGGVRRVLGAVPANTTMSFPAVLPPGRNEVVVWVAPDDAKKAKLNTTRVRGTVTIQNRHDVSCRRAARLTVTAESFVLGTPPTADELMPNVVQPPATPGTPATPATPAPETPPAAPPPAAKP